jgi:hypothetical protein
MSEAQNASPARYLYFWPFYSRSSNSSLEQLSPALHVMFFALGVLVMRVVHNLVRRLLGHVMMYLEGLVSAFASPPTDGRRGPEMLAAVVSGCSETAVRWPARISSARIRRYQSQRSADCIQNMLNEVESNRRTTYRPPARSTAT